MSCSRPLRLVGRGMRLGSLVCSLVDGKDLVSVCRMALSSLCWREVGRGMVRRLALWGGGSLFGVVVGDCLSLCRKVVLLAVVVRGRMVFWCFCLWILDLVLGLVEAVVDCVWFRLVVVLGLFVLGWVCMMNRVCIEMMLLMLVLVLERLRLVALIGLNLLRSLWSWLEL